MRRIRPIQTGPSGVMSAEAMPTFRGPASMCANSASEALATETIRTRASAGTRVFSKVRFTFVLRQLACCLPDANLRLPKPTASYRPTPSRPSFRPGKGSRLGQGDLGLSAP